MRLAPSIGCKRSYACLLQPIVSVTRSNPCLKDLPNFFLQVRFLPRLCLDRRDGLIRHHGEDRDVSGPARRRLRGQFSQVRNNLGPRSRLPALPPTMLQRIQAVAGSHWQQRHRHSCELQRYFVSGNATSSPDLSHSSSIFMKENELIISSNLYAVNCFWLIF